MSELTASGSAIDDCGKWEGFGRMVGPASADAVGGDIMNLPPEYVPGSHDEWQSG